MHGAVCSSNTVASRAGLRPVGAYVKFVGSSGQRRSIYPLTLAVVDLRQFVSLAHTCYRCWPAASVERETWKAIFLLPAGPAALITRSSLRAEMLYFHLSLHVCMRCDQWRPCIASPSWLLALYKWWRIITTLASLSQLLQSHASSWWIWWVW